MLTQSPVCLAWAAWIMLCMIYPYLMSHSVKVLQIFDRKLLFCGLKTGFWLSTTKNIRFSPFNHWRIIVFACFDSDLLGSWITVLPQIRPAGIIFSFIIFIQRSQYIRPKVTAHKYSGIIWGRALYEEIRQTFCVTFLYFFGKCVKMSYTKHFLGSK